ncbi:MAG: hypothetical protein RLZZ480_387 [Candidatus Parcubacteria bacterium]
MTPENVGGIKEKLSRIAKLDTETKIEVLTAWKNDLEHAVLHDTEDTELLETVEKLLRVETLKRDMEALITKRTELV